MLRTLTLTAVVGHLESTSAPAFSISKYTNTISQDRNLPIHTRRQLATSLTPSNTPVSFSWDIPRTREGFYHYRAGLPAATKRALAYGPYADLLWLETGTASVAAAASFARDIRAALPGKKLVYNLSPSFNWAGAGFDDAALKNFIWDLAREGFVLQLVSLAGLHSTATVTAELSRAFREEGMLAYVRLVQSREMALGVDVLRHQRWSGAEYVDGMLGAVLSGSSGSRSMGEGNTEGQFQGR